MNEKVRVDISISAILKVLAVLGFVYLLFLIRDILILIFIAGILVAAFAPIINKWSKKIGKTLSILILVLLIIGGIAGFTYLIVPPFITQTKQLIAGLPEFANSFSIIRSYLPSIEKGLSALTESLGGITGSFISITTSVVGAIVAFFTVLVLTIYFLIDEQVFTRFLSTVIPKSKKEGVTSLIRKISAKIGEWLRGQLLLGIIIGIIVYIGLTIIGVKYALALAVISGVLEILPIVGPIISGTLAALISLSISPITALIVVVFYVLLQQLENNFIVPKVMSKAVGLPPAIIIIAILIGGKLLGVIGALLAVPMIAIIYVVFQEWETIQKLASKNEA